MLLEEHVVLLVACQGPKLCHLYREEAHRHSPRGIDPEGGGHRLGSAQPYPLRGKYKRKGLLKPDWFGLVLDRLPLGLGDSLGDVSHQVYRPMNILGDKSCRKNHRLVVDLQLGETTLNQNIRQLYRKCKPSSPKIAVVIMSGFIVPVTV